MRHAVVALFAFALAMSFPGPAGAEDAPPSVKGRVVDEKSQPVAGVDVVANASTDDENRATTGPDGTFAVPLGHRRFGPPPLLARSADGKRLGVYPQQFSTEPPRPVEITLKAGRSVAVRVVDPNQTPIPGATVLVLREFQVLAEGTTGPDGAASLMIPTDSPVDWVVGHKSGRGLDFSEYGPIDQRGNPRGGLAPADFPASVTLVLDGARTAQIKAVDGDDKPLAGVRFGPWLIRKEGRTSTLNLGSYRSLGATTDAEGIATFDYLPKNPREALIFWPRGVQFARRRVEVGEDEVGPVVAKLTSNETMRGRVVHRDGSPAPGISIRAQGSGQGSDRGQALARTAADGSYEMILPSGETYGVWVEADDWTAISRLDVELPAGRPAGGVDFILIKGTLLQGRVTVGPDSRPVPGQVVYVQETGIDRIPLAELARAARPGRGVMRQLSPTTDGEGRYSVRVGPGRYKVWGPARTETVEFNVADEAEIVRDFKMPRPENGPIAGRVVEADSGNGVARAKVEIVAANLQSVPISVVADAEGRFRAERALDPLTIHASNGDGSRAAIVEVGADVSEVTIPIAPTATATGRLLDEQGKPAAHQKLWWGRQVYLDDKQGISMTLFAPRVVTDAEGKFTLPSLVVGQEYNVSVDRDGSYPSTGRVRAESPGPFDVGTLQVGKYVSPEMAEEMSSFRGGPVAGDAAPAIEATTLDGRPLKLTDFRGKYVLLDFWATWCGPCIGEIPQLQAIHDAFAKDPRFTILSLSLDEKIDEPRAFQDRRKLPWAQGFLGEGIHSATPGSYGVRAIPAFVLVGPDGKIVARGMRGEAIKAEVTRALGVRP